MSGLNWDRARRQDGLRPPHPSAAKPFHVKRKPTQRQLRYLAHLRQERGIKGRLPKSREAASEEIDRLLNGEPEPKPDLAADIERSVARRVRENSS